jgi:aryl-alcohol dehydrogenase-like predicted oxidoreductase
MDSKFKDDFTRRDFIRVTTATSLLMASGQHAFGQVEQRGGMPFRPLGKTGVKVSLLGLGGSHIGHPPEAEAIRIMRAAIDGGLTFMDNSWDYGNGQSEERMGKALQDGYRDKAFLMTKIDGRTKASAAKQIDECLKRLKTDHVDLMQFHEVIRVEDPDRIFAEGGAMEAMQEAKKTGKVRFVGFTGHKDPFVHLRMLEVAEQHNFVFDTVQMPLNVMDAHFRSFQHQVLPSLVKQGIGVLGMKSMGSGQILKAGVVKATECLRYALSLPVSVVITGIESMKDLQQAFEVARNFKPLSAEQTTDLLAKTADAAKTGKYERFKTQTVYDATAQHPEYLG